LDMTFHAYILQSLKDGSYYIGSTNNLEDRVERHNQGRSQYTKLKRPWKLLYSEEYIDRPSAVKRENEVKGKKKKG
jgi:putative endonuclease